MNINLSLSSLGSILISLPTRVRRKKSTIFNEVSARLCKTWPSQPSQDTEALLVFILALQVPSPLLPAATLHEVSANEPIAQMARPKRAITGMQLLMCAEVSKHCNVYFCWMEIETPHFMLDVTV